MIFSILRKLSDVTLKNVAPTFRSISHLTTHCEEPRAAESGLRLPNETEYSFSDFMARNTPYYPKWPWALQGPRYSIYIVLI